MPHTVCWNQIHCSIDTCDLRDSSSTHLLCVFSAMPNGKMIKMMIGPKKIFCKSNLIILIYLPPIKTSYSLYEAQIPIPPIYCALRRLTSRNRFLRRHIPLRQIDRNLSPICRSIYLPKHTIKKRAITIIFVSKIEYFFTITSLNKMMKLATVLSFLFAAFSSTDAFSTSLIGVFIRKNS